jgi:UDP-glucose 4-epimerase
LVRKLKDSVVLVTGGTGSFGSTMVRHLINKGAAEIRVFSRDEAKQDNLRSQIKDPRVRFYLGDTRDRQSVDNAVKGSEFVFHAAALKQVPSAEFFPLEAVKTNISGSANVLYSAVENGVKGVVCLSTDKAVYPINAMGMSKALMEKTAMAIARDSQDSDTTIAVTRYGNVMYSRGSVIPLFVRQAIERRPLTITNAAMTRFLMSLQESVDLVEYALTNANTGDLMVKKAPAATVGTIAESVAQLFGADSKNILEIGVRHGEKLYESLLGVEEQAKAQDHGGYFRVPLDTRDLNYEVFFDKGEVHLEGVEGYTSHNTTRLNVAEVTELIKALPEIKELING